MREHGTIRTDLVEHPAVRAWSELRPARVVPEAIEILKSRNESKVYWLSGVGPRGSNVVAKWCPRANGWAERTIYQEVLPHLPFVALRYYGLLEDQDAPFCWVFIEDAAGVPYSPETEAHRVRAAEWLGVMHTSAPEAIAKRGLPDRGPDRYLGCLRSARERIRRNLGNPALNHDDRTVLNSIVCQCGVLEQCWRRVEECCARMPRTFVHGDFNGSNLHLRTTAAGIALLPFDWECAGWGVLAVDLVLAGLDLPTYRSAVRRFWPSLDLEAFQRFAVIGRIFRLLGFVEWESKGLACKWLHKPMKHMRCYEAEIAREIKAAGLEP